MANVGNVFYPTFTNVFFIFFTFFTFLTFFLNFHLNVYYIYGRQSPIQVVTGPGVEQRHCSTPTLEPLHKTATLHEDDGFCWLRSSSCSPRVQMFPWVCSLHFHISSSSFVRRQMSRLVSDYVPARLHH